MFHLKMLANYSFFHLHRFFSSFSFVNIVWPAWNYRYGELLYAFDTRHTRVCVLLQTISDWQAQVSHNLANEDTSAHEWQRRRRCWFKSNTQNWRKDNAQRKHHRCFALRLLCYSLITRERCLAHLKTLMTFAVGRELYITFIVKFNNVTFKCFHGNIVITIVVTRMKFICNLIF